MSLHPTLNKTHPPFQRRHRAQNVGFRFRFGIYRWCVCACPWKTALQVCTQFHSEALLGHFNILIPCPCTRVVVVLAPTGGVQNRAGLRAREGSLTLSALPQHPWSLNHHSSRPLWRAQTRLHVGLRDACGRSGGRYSRSGWPPS